MLEGTKSPLTLGRGLILNKTGRKFNIPSSKKDATYRILEVTDNKFKVSLNNTNVKDQIINQSPHYWMD